MTKSLTEYHERIEDYENNGEGVIEEVAWVNGCIIAVAILVSTAIQIIYDQTKEEKKDKGQCEEKQSEV